MVYELDIAKASTSALANIFRTNDVVIDTAGFVSEKQSFVDLTDHIVASLESIPEGKRPFCWFMAGAAILDMDEHGRRGVDLPLAKRTYWPHRVNFNRICQTTLDWRILCPGPMVAQSPLGLDRMRISLAQLPAQMPTFSRFLPKALALPFFLYRVPEMIISYADAAALMLAHTTPNDEMSYHRVGLACRLVCAEGKSVGQPDQFLLPSARSMFVSEYGLTLSQAGCANCSRLIATSGRASSTNVSSAGRLFLRLYNNASP